MPLSSLGASSGSSATGGTRAPSRVFTWKFANGSLLPDRTFVDAMALPILPSECAVSTKDGDVLLPRASPFFFVVRPGTVRHAIDDRRQNGTSPA